MPLVTKGARRTNLLIARIADSQHGVLARRQLLELNVGPRLIAHWLGTGRLFKVFRGTYALARPARGPHSFWMAATLRGGEGAVLSGASAAAAWGFMDARRTIDVCRPAGRVVHANTCRPHQSYHLRIGKGSLAEGEVTRAGSIPVMTPARTLIDLAASEVGARQLRRAFAGAGRDGLLNEQCLKQIRARGPSFAGHRRLAALLDLWLPDTGKLRSAMESEFLMLCGKRGIPAPRTNTRVGGFEVDCHWPGTGIVVELDSRTFHDDGFGFQDDRSKGNALSAQGYTVLRFTHLMITVQPETVAQILRQHLETRR
jgi:hypothetical protein